MFFGAESVTGGAVVIVALWVALVWTMIAFAPVKRASMWLDVPCLAWVSFAMALNVEIART